MAKNITLKSVSYVSADGAEILKGLSVTLPYRRIGIVGNNGAGKTTLLRIIAGELKPSA